MAIAEDYLVNSIGVQIGSLEVKLAANSLEIDAAQALRYKVFYEEMRANPSLQVKNSKRDVDPFDTYFDHLLVIDHDLEGKISDKVVGTYRLNRGIKSGKGSPFYTSGEYNIDKLINFKGNILELGRSCVRSDYRNGKTMQLLWRSIAGYVLFYDIKIMFGCASFPGIDKKIHSACLSYLYSEHLAPLEIRPFALKDRYIEMKSEIYRNDSKISIRKTMPPLIKGYLRLGAYIGDGAVIDYDFNTLDVCIVLPTKKVANRYMSHYDRY